ncbi:hypothetical protein ICN84_07775 [Akkermansia glycaniphila]|uniref:hypothetical protein n=1 Tax=Akkermansia glycaniphila TaxID=1679444 RepID=UPI001C024055|nr:hypothetical protein [Akkermansia glycaniphila]MBT9449971.1 hypothetical protein [Akkermansia glycaniphila]
MDTKKKQVMTAADLAREWPEYFTSVRVVYSMIADGRIPCVTSPSMLRNRHRFIRKDIEATIRDWKSMPQGKSKPRMDRRGTRCIMLDHAFNPI